MGSSFFNYAVGVSLANKQNGADKKALLSLGVAANLIAIGYFKYFNFFIANMNDFFGTHYRNEQILLPLAISFFTFQQIAFLVDAYKGETREYNFLNYFLFVTFFPQLIAGPIVHHKEMLPQFARNAIYRFDLSRLNIGFTIFFIGLFKKVILADGIALYSTPVFTASEIGVTLTFFEGWIGALAYTFQLYFDFSGYSDMAIGIARMFGIRLPLNFNSPYKAVNIISFWRRWHITLSRFLKDYLYIPLGGNRKGPLRRYINLIITMVLGGLWHGAGWTFIMWGALHGFYLIVNQTFKKIKQILFRNSTLWGFGRHISLIITFISVVIGWVFFRAQSFKGALNILKAMTGMNGISLPSSLSGRIGPFEMWLAKMGVEFDGMSMNNIISFEGLIWIFVLFIIVWAFPNTQQIMIRIKPALETYNDEIRVDKTAFFQWKPSKIWAVGAGLIAALSILGLSQVSEFLYFQF